MDKNINQHETDDKLNRALSFRSRSAVISQIMVIAVFAALVASVFLLPWMFKLYLGYYARPDWLFIPSMVNLYTALLPAFIADFCLYFLLHRIRAGEVFSDANVRSLRIISWCCYIECVVFFVFGFYFLISFAMSFACAFMGTILRVVKNSFEQAVELKRENDFTI
jgi:Protein of unknown function (DUF3036).